MDIRISALSKTFAGSTGPILALDAVDLEVASGEFVALVGASGCGKSTLLFSVAGLVAPTSGEIRVGGKRVEAPGPDRAVVFQGDAVFPWMTVEQNVRYGLRFMGVARQRQNEIVERWLELVGLSDWRAAFPKELSGGMKKRVDLARAYAIDPSVLLMDEPFGALDALTKDKMQIDLLELARAIERPKTVLFVTHDLEEGIFLADRVAVMTPRPGTIAEIVKVDLPRPRSPDVKTSSHFQELRRHLGARLGHGIGGPNGSDRRIDSEADAA